MWPGQKLSLILLSQQKSSKHSAQSHERLGWWVADWCECVPDSPAGLDSKVKVESHRLHFRQASWEIGWRVTILQFVLLSQHCQCAIYQDAHFPNCSRGVQSIHFSLPINKTKPPLRVPGKACFKSTFSKTNITPYP